MDHRLPVIHGLTLEELGDRRPSPIFLKKKTEHSAPVSKYFSRVQ
jgi:hypothetical protein